MQSQANWAARLTPMLAEGVRLWWSLVLAWDG
ncbi:hypothetical protein HDF12_003286 [Edaphobacter lichenicola]|uniref:Uncharacterized protein n=2 Tax=Tunturiibacter TaxID=3154218 RepID=A0A7Y9T3Z5_9BACT|nr:hypothetical protein [Edaphobacter lichenicola]NYF52887.1 hypothetical protein [Edaphobacter lichenicola]